MRWLDPADCLAAEECLKAGNALEAAQLLLGSPHRRHRAARRLLLAIGDRLIEEAGDAYRRGDVLVAWEMIDCAGHCAELGAQAAALRDEIAQKRQELEKQQEWRDKRLERASAWAQQGRRQAQTPSRTSLYGRGNNERASRAPTPTPAIPAVSRNSENTEQVQISAGRPSGVRASAASEHDLDIPAFIRRQSE